MQVLFSCAFCIDSFSLAERWYSFEFLVAYHIDFFLRAYHVSLNQALLEPCEGELGCVLWDDAVRRSIPTPSCAGQHHIAGASFFALVSF